jgi:hypothetical protein
MTDRRPKPNPEPPDELQVDYDQMDDHLELDERQRRLREARERHGA